jgi:hypothetical protein
MKFGTAQPDIVTIRNPHITKNKREFEHGVSDAMLCVGIINVPHNCANK